MTTIQDLKQRFDSIDVVDPILLNDIDDTCNEWLVPMGIDGEEAENELVFDGDDLTWGDVATGAGVGEPLANTRRRRVPRQTTGASSIASTSRDKAILEEEEEEILEVEEEEEVQEVYSSSSSDNDQDVDIDYTMDDASI